MTMTLARRPRFTRKPTGRIPRLTYRDIEILKLHRLYRYLRSSTIQRFVGGNHKKLSERLKDLYHELAYLDRPIEQAHCFRAYTHEIITCLSDEGDSFLHELGIPYPHPHELVEKGRCGANRQFDHAMMISDTLASINLEVTLRPSFEFIPWPRFLKRQKASAPPHHNPFTFSTSINHTSPTTGDRYVHHSHHHIPDGMFALRDREHRTRRVFFLEAERTNRIFSKALKQTSFLKHMLSYISITTHPLLTSDELRSFAVLVVTHSQAKIDSMCTLIANHLGRSSARFLFKALPNPKLGFIDPPASIDFWHGWQYADFDNEAQRWKQIDLSALFSA